MDKTEAINWDDLQLFLSIVAAGSMTKASASIGVSQPTLGRRMKVLEQQLGAPLFHRLPGQLEPTSLGESIAALLKPVRGSVAGILRLAELETAKKVVIRLSASTTFSMILTEHIPELVRQVPRVSLDIAASRVVSNVGRRESDMAIRLRKTPSTGSIVQRRLGVIAFAVYGARSIVGSVGADFAWSRGTPFIGLSGDRPPPQPAWLDRFMAERDGILVHRLGEVFLRLSAIKAGIGVSLLPCILGDREPDLVRLTPPVKELTESAFLLVYADLSHHPAIRAVADNIQAFFRTHAQRFAGLLELA
jgi:DNA-binding transcriptional LysR family regulator